MYTFLFSEFGLIDERGKKGDLALSCCIWEVGRVAIVVDCGTRRWPGKGYFG